MAMTNGCIVPVVDTGCRKKFIPAQGFDRSIENLVEKGEEKFFPGRSTG